MGRFVELTTPTFNHTPGRGPVELTLGEGTVNVVYVRSVTATGPLMINQFKLK